MQVFPYITSQHEGHFETDRVSPHPKINSPKFNPCLTLRSKDTIETVDKQEQKYSSQSYAALGKKMVKNAIHPCMNLQKKDTGLSGFMVEVSGDAGLKHLDTPTQQIFRGISVAKCIVSELQSIELLRDKAAIQKKLSTFMTQIHMRNREKCTIILEQVLPNSCCQDFWWFNQTCEPKKRKSLRDCILYDHSNNSVNFSRRVHVYVQSRPGHLECGQSYKDACAWNPLLNGSIGLYTQKCGDLSAFFFVCDSDFTHVASDVVRSMKSDLGNSISAFDLCDSKEMWFLEKFALRIRLRLIQQAAAFLGIKVPEQHDLHANSTQHSQRLAVSLCSSQIEQIECTSHVDAHDNMPERRVRHYRACTDVKHQKGCFPIFLGDLLGFLLVFPEKINYQSFAIYSDTMPFTNNYIPGGVYLWPTINVSKQSRANIDKIHAEKSPVLCT